MRIPGLAESPACHSCCHRPRVTMGSIVAFGVLDADSLGSLVDTIKRESGPSTMVSLASTCTALWRGQAFRLQNGTGPHALKSELDLLREECIGDLQQKLECEDLRSLLRSSPDLSPFAVDASDARMIASLCLHDLSGEADGMTIRCKCCFHSFRSPPVSARSARVCAPASATSCSATLLFLPLVVERMADLSPSMSSWASRQWTPSTSITGNWARIPPVS